MKDLNTEDADYNNKEEKRVIEGTETETAIKLGEIKEGEVSRTDHSATYQFTTSGPTSNVDINSVTVQPEEEK